MVFCESPPAQPYICTIIPIYLPLHSYTYTFTPIPVAIYTSDCTVKKHTIQNPSRIYESATYKKICFIVWKMFINRPKRFYECPGPKNGSLKDSHSRKKAFNEHPPPSKSYGTFRVSFLKLNVFVFYYETFFCFTELTKRFHRRSFILCACTKNS